MIDRRPLVCVGVLFLSTFWPAEPQAHAARFNVALDYDAGPGCPDAADLRAAVIARLGHDPFVDSAPDHVLVRIAPRDGSLHGRIEWRDAAGKWAGDQAFSVVGADCAALVRAMGFAVAVQIQLLATTRASSDDKVAGPEAPDPAPRPPGAQPVVKPLVPAVASGEAATAATVTSVSPPSTARSGPVLAIGAGPSVGIGMSSGPIVIGRLFGALAWQRVSLELAGLVSAPATTRRADGAGFSQQHLLLSAAACGSRDRWTACLVANAGEVRMVGQDVDRPSSAWAPIFQTGARVGFVQSLGRRVFLSAHTDGLTNVIRWTGSLDNVPVWTAPRFAVAVAIDAGVRFP